MKKKFTMLQLYSILDGRLSTNMGDIYDMLNHITGEDLMTHHLPVAKKYLETVNPKWFQSLKAELSEIKKQAGDNFESHIAALKDMSNPNRDVPQLTAVEKSGFGKYMIDNSLLLK